MTTGVDESKINKVSHIVESFSGIMVPPNKPIIGDSVFTQCAGIHSDGDNKKQLYYNDLLPERFGRSFSGIMVPPNKPIIGDSVFTQCAGIHSDGDNKKQLYYNDLLPERFGREREYALGKTSGKANIRKNLEVLGIELSEEHVKTVTDRVIALGDKKEIVTQSYIPFNVADYIKHATIPSTVQLVNYAISASKGLQPMAMVRLCVDGVEYEANASGDGQYDAFVRALRSIYRTKLKRKFPVLTNYTVNIPPGGRSDALVHTTITWEATCPSLWPTSSSTPRYPRQCSSSTTPSARAKGCSPWPWSGSASTEWNTKPTPRATASMTHSSGLCEAYTAPNSNANFLC